MGHFLTVLVVSPDKAVLRSKPKHMDDLAFVRQILGGDAEHVRTKLSPSVDVFVNDLFDVELGRDDVWEYNQVASLMTGVKLRGPAIFAATNDEGELDSVPPAALLVLNDVASHLVRTVVSRLLGIAKKSKTSAIST